MGGTAFGRSFANSVSACQGVLGTRKKCKVGRKIGITIPIAPLRRNGAIDGGAIEGKPEKGRRSLMRRLFSL